MSKGVYQHKKHSEETKRKIGLANKGKLRSEEQNRKNSEIHKGFKHSEESKIRMSESHKGKKNSEEHCRNISKARMGQKMLTETKKKLSEIHKRIGTKPPSNKDKKPSLQTRKKLSEANKGMKMWNWKGGITSLNKKIRASFEYKLWREAVFKRDDYTCVWCSQRGIRLQADHIKPFAFYPALRFEIDNGRTLCVECHKKTDTFGNGRLES